MKTTTVLFLISVLALSGCANRDNLSPFSPRVRQQLQNQGGKIGELETMNNSMKMQIGQLKNESEIHARDIETMQQGSDNWSNTGIQIMQGDGGILAIVLLGALGMALLFSIFYFKHEATKNKKAAEIFAQQINRYNDPNLYDQVCLAALNTDVESEVYHMLVKKQ